MTEPYDQDKEEEWVLTEPLTETVDEVRERRGQDVPSDGYLDPPATLDELEQRIGQIEERVERL